LPSCDQFGNRKTTLRLDRFYSFTKSLLPQTAPSCKLVTDDDWSKRYQHILSQLFLTMYVFDRLCCPVAPLRPATILPPSLRVNLADPQNRYTYSIDGQMRYVPLYAEAIFSVMSAQMWDNALRPLPVVINHGEIPPHSGIRWSKAYGKQQRQLVPGHRCDATVALCLGNREWLDIGLWECSRFSREGPNSPKWHDDTLKVIRLMCDMLVDMHKVMKEDMTQLKKVIVWGIVSSSM